jgi:hypothetical protein
MQDVLDYFYEKFEATFGLSACRYNVHAFYHIGLVRKRAPLTETSAFKFEKSYSALKMHARLAKKSKGKHIMKKIFLRCLGSHCCKKSVKYSPSTSYAIDDSLIYVRDTSNNYKFYKIKEIDEEKKLLCATRLINYPFIKEIKGGEMTLKFDDVGAFEFGGYDDEDVSLEESDISGKAVIAGDYIISIPNNVLLDT